MPETPTEMSPNKVRIGLAIVSVIFAAAVVLFFVVEDTIGQAIFFGVAVVTLVRMVLLVRWFRRRTT